jgi:magnesium transporter
MAAAQYLKYFNPLGLFDTKRTGKIFKVNPVMPVERVEAEKVSISVFDYTAAKLSELEFEDVPTCFAFKNNHHTTWINVNGINKQAVEEICNHFDIHYLIQEDILSVGQRPKMDELDPVLFGLLNMLYFNDRTGEVETEQISVLLGKDFVLSFQEDASRDVFNPMRDKLRIANSKLRQTGADYLCYTMLDMIVDSYYGVMEKIGERIELLEERIIRGSNKRTLAEINALRKELIVLKRNVSPVRELINGFVRSESDLLEDKTTKYFKDIYDHIVQANELAENYRDMMINLQDLYLSNVNLKMNEVMKVMAVVTCLLAPATVIGGIFGMNFDRLPYIHDHNGFWVAAGLMLIIPLVMVLVFRKRGWF